jgi:hypothetical protein
LEKLKEFLEEQRASVASYGYVPSSPILVTLMMEVLISSDMSVLIELHGVTSQKTPFFIVIAVKTSDLNFIRSIP